MNFLVFGLGSMGKRRIRCLKELGYKNIFGFDLKKERREEVEENYSIKTFDKLDNINFNEMDVFIVSTPPDKHAQYIELAIKNLKPVFVEASVVLDNLKSLNELAKKNKVLVAPSCTLRFHPAIKDIKKIVKSKKFGELTNFSYHCGQYLRDWHPWEDIKDFYVSKRETGACREMVPFELTWIVDIIGFPKNIIGFNGKTFDMGVDINDSYVISLDFGNCYGNLTVDVVSRYATRSLILNMEYGQILWRWDDNVVKLYDALNQRWINYNQPEGQSVNGYNKNIIEEMYIDEIRSFIGAVKGETIFPNALDEDIKVLELLNKVEEHNEH